MHSRSIGRFRAAVATLLLLAAAAAGAQAPKAPRGDLTIDPAAIMAPWKGDLDQMIERRVGRVLVVPGKTSYFQDKGTQRGVTFDAFRLVEAELNRQVEREKKLKQKHLKVRFVFIPVRRDLLRAWQAPPPAAFHRHTQAAIEQNPSDARKDKPLPEVKYRFIEEEIGKTEPLLYILKKQKRSLEDQGPGTFLGFFYTDFLAWQGLENAVSAEKATSIYLDLWRTFPPIWAKDARTELWAGKPANAKALAEILAYCEKRKYMPYKITASNGSVTLTSKLNPYVEVMQIFGFKQGCSYFKVVTKRDQDFINLVQKEIKVDKQYKAVLTKSISAGNDVNQITITKN